MVLKKPSEYFNKEVITIDNVIQELDKSPELNTFSDAFESFKNNLSKIEVLSEFSETLNNYNDNIQKVNFLSEKVGDIQEEIQNLLKKEDLDRAMMSQLLVVEQSVLNVQNKVKGINEKNLVEIRLDVGNLTKSVDQFLENEVPKYKKLFVDAELRSNRRYEELEQNVNQTLESIGEFVDEKYQELTENLQGINEESLSSIIKDFKELEENILEFRKEEIPKYKSLIVETERKTESKLNQFDEKLDQTLLSFGEKIEKTIESVDEKIELDINSLEDLVHEIDDKFIELKEREIPKYKSLIVETERKTESKLNQFDEKLERTLLSFGEKNELDINSLEDLVNEIDDKFIELKEKEIPEYKSLIVETERKTEFKLNEFQEKLNETVSNVLEKVKLIEGDNTQLVDTVHKKIEDVKNLSEQVINYISNSQKNNEDYKKDLSKKVSNLEIEIIRNESHIKVQNENLEQIQEDVRFAIERLNLDELEEKNYELGKKVKYIEKVFEKFDSKSLTEGLLNEPPEVKNTDPLTPLDQNFVTLEHFQEHYRLFISRIQQQLATLGGGGETRLKYLDDIVGISTNPSAYDGKFLKYDHPSKKFIFSDVVNPTVNISEQNIIYVAKDGNDSNIGDLTNPKLTIKSAISLAVAENVIKVAPGIYYEDNPISIPDQVSIVGHSLRETTIIPLNPEQDLFHVGNGCYATEMSFKGSLSGKAIFAFDPIKSRYIDQSPYIQNCTNFIPDSIGMRIDGTDAIGPIKSMVLDSYTQYNQGGIGVSITNEGYAQLVSLFTICNETAVYCGSGGACDLTNSNSSFGDYGLVADGVSPLKYTGSITQSTGENADTFIVELLNPTTSVSNAVYDNVTGIATITVNTNHNFNVGMGVSIVGLGFTCPSGPGIVTYPSGNNGYIFEVQSIPAANQFSVNVGTSTLPHTYYPNAGYVNVNVVRPFDGQVVYFNELFYTVKLTLVDGGSDYTEPPTITIGTPDETSWGVVAQAAAGIENGSVTVVDMISNGRGYKTIPEVNVTPGITGINTAVVIAELVPEYYTIQKASEIVGNFSIITINENVPFEVGIGTTVSFFKQSKILASGHSFEFIGSGTDIAQCLPSRGGVTIEVNETNSRNGGLVVYTSTNQSGDFKIGDGVTVNQNTGSITGNAYTKSLFSTMTPYILSLGGL